MVSDAQHTLEEMRADPNLPSTSTAGEKEPLSAKAHTAGEVNPKENTSGEASRKSRVPSLVCSCCNGRKHSID